VAETGVARAIARAQRIEPGVALLVVGLALAVYLQGAFYPKAQVLVAVPLLVGALLVPRRLTFTRQDTPVLLVAAGLAGWAVVDGVLTGHLIAGLHYLLIVAGVLGLAGVCKQLPVMTRIGVAKV